MSHKSQTWNWHVPPQAGVMVSITQHRCPCVSCRTWSRLWAQQYRPRTGAFELAANPNIHAILDALIGVTE